MNDDFFKYLAVTDQLDEFLGLEEKETEDEMIDDFDEEEFEFEDEDDYEE